MPTPRKDWLKIVLIVLVPLVLLAAIVGILVGKGSCTQDEPGQVPEKYANPEKPGPGWGK